MFRARGISVVMLAFCACADDPRRVSEHAPLQAHDAASPAAPSFDASSPSGDAGPAPDPVIEDAADADGDGLSNAYERARGLDPFDADSDEDGVSDLAEFAAHTDGTDAASHPMSRGDFYFVVPFEAAPEPARATLVVATGLQATDLFILMDTTGTMGPAVEQLREKLSTSIVPAVSELVGDLQIGVGHFEDIANGFYGDRLDVVLGIDQHVTSDAAAVQSGLNELKVAGGADFPEGAIPALFSLITGVGLGEYLAHAPACPSGRFGYGCLRSDAASVILLITDAELHNGPDGVNPYGKEIMPEPPWYEDTVGALQEVGAHVISVLLYGDGTTAPPNDYPPALQLSRLSKDTGALGADGKPLLFSVGQNAEGLDTRVVDAARAVANDIPVDVSVVVRDDPSDAVDATTLIERIVANSTGGVADPRDASRVCAPNRDAIDASGDGHADTFQHVRPGTPLCFDVIARANTTVPSTARPALYKAFIDVVADGRSVLESRSVYFLVPPSDPLLE